MQQNMAKGCMEGIVTKALARSEGGYLSQRNRRYATIFGARRSSLPEYLERGEVEALVKHAPNPQSRLLMLLQWRAGLRVSEAVALEVGDLHLDGERPTLAVRMGKGRKPRMVPVHPELGMTLQNMLAFGGLRRGRLVEAHRVTAWRWVEQAAQKAVENHDLGPDRHIGTHTLRHSAARHWLANGVPINKVSIWLGHAHLQTTLVYLAILPDAAGDMTRVP